MRYTCSVCGVRTDKLLLPRYCVGCGNYLEIEPVGMTYCFSGVILDENPYEALLDNEDGSGTWFRKDLMRNVHRTPAGRLTFYAKAGCSLRTVVVDAEAGPYTPRFDESGRVE